MIEFIVIFKLVGGGESRWEHRAEDADVVREYWAEEIITARRHTNADRARSTRQYIYRNNEIYEGGRDVVFLDMVTEFHVIPKNR